MKKTKTVCLSAILIAVALTACGKSSAATDTEMAGSSYKMAAPEMNYAAESEDIVDYDYEEAAADEGYGEVSSKGSEAGEVTESGAAANSDRKLIRTVNMSVETLEYDALMGAVKGKVSQLGGYFESINEGKSTYSNNVRSASLTIRIPRENADNLIAVMEQQSNITSRSENISDVTLDYVDKESHKKTLKAEEARLLKFMEEAESVEDLISIEARLSDVRYQIESMESQLRTYDNKINYTTVYLDITEVEKITPQEEPGFLQHIKEGFLDSLSDAIDIVKNIFAWFIINSPYLVLLAIFALLVFLIVLRPIIKKIKKSNEKSRQAYLEHVRQRQEAQQQAQNQTQQQAQNSQPQPQPKPAQSAQTPAHVEAKDNKDTNKENK